MHQQTRKAINRRIAQGYTKPTKREIRWLVANEGQWAVRLVHLGLYGEEIEGPICRTVEEYKRSARTVKHDFVLRYVDKFYVNEDKANDQRGDAQ